MRATRQTPSSSNKRFLAEDITYFCVLDFEATCWENERSADQEIIEFPSVLISHNWVHNSTDFVSEFHQYVKPVLRPTISDFCTSLTGITQTQVDTANPLPDVLTAHQEWLIAHVPEEHYTHVVFVTCGNWDLKTMLPLEYTNKSADLPTLRSDLYHHFINIKYLFESCHRAVKARGMTTMLEFLRIPLEGRHHSGIDDTRNIASILRQLLTVPNEQGEVVSTRMVMKQAQHLRISR